MTDDTTEHGEGTEVRCDFCRHPIPEKPVVASVGGSDYQFCSRGCREALETSEYVFTEYHGFMGFAKKSKQRVQRRRRKPASEPQHTKTAKLTPSASNAPTIRAKCDRPQAFGG